MKLGGLCGLNAYLLCLKFRNFNVLFISIYVVLFRNPSISDLSHSLRERFYKLPFSECVRLALLLLFL